MKKLIVVMTMAILVMTGSTIRAEVKETIFAGNTSECMRSYAQFWKENYRSDLGATRVCGDDGIETYEIFYVTEDGRGDDVIVARIRWNGFMTFLDDLDDYIGYNYYEIYTRMLDFMGVWWL